MKGPSNEEETAMDNTPELTALRDSFAREAMGSLLSPKDFHVHKDSPIIAEWSYVIADHMLKARISPNEGDVTT